VRLYWLGDVHLGCPERFGQSQEARRVDFKEAASAFYDPLSTTFPDDDHSETEQRFLTVGRSARGTVLVVAHTEEDDTIRIISARAATRRELKFYEEN
jgi:hypothetical protein